MVLKSPKSHVTLLLMAAGFAAMISASPLAAQGGPGGWGPGMMMGPGMMGRGAMWGGGMCSPRAAGLAEWRIARIEQRIQLTDEQRPKLSELRDASAKAATIITAACPTEIPQSPAARLEIMEKRLTAMLEAVKIVRPAFEGFYNSLSSEQKDKVNSAGPRGWGWHRWGGGPSRTQ